MKNTDQPTTVLATNDSWKKLDVATPYPVIAVIAIDLEGNFAMLHRSKNVRSAPDRWSFPTGLMEPGQTMIQNAARELEEELGIIADQRFYATLPSWENIPGDGWHWVLSPVVVLAPHLITEITNREPDKHDEVMTPRISFFTCAKSFCNSFHMDDSLRDWLISKAPMILRTIEEVQDRYATHLAVINR